MTALNTHADQYQHYAAIRARLRGATPVVKVLRSQVLPDVADQEKPHAPSPYAGVAKSGWGGTWRHEEAAAIIAETAEKHAITVEDLTSYKRSDNIVFARWEAYYRLKNELGYSLNMVGIACGGKEHTSVLAGIRKYMAKQIQEL